MRTELREESGTSKVLWKEVYFDGLGREIRTRTEGPDSKVIVTETQYDAMGNVRKRSLPFFEGGTKRWVEYAHDLLGWVTPVTQPDQSVSRTAYDRNRTTLYDAKNHMKVLEKDALGNITTIEEYMGPSSQQYSLYATTDFQYDLLGNLRGWWMPREIRPGSCITPCPKRSPWGTSNSR